MGGDRFSRLQNISREEMGDGTIAVFAELPIMSNYDKKPRHVEKNTQDSSLLVGNHGSTNLRFN